jgi:hypothetical protein
MSGDVPVPAPRVVSAEPLTAVRLVPVVVFAAGHCDEYPCSDCERHAGFGLADAVPPGGDCNRAVGRIYRVDDVDRGDDGHSLTVWVTAADLEWLRKRWGDE